MTPSALLLCLVYCSRHNISRIRSHQHCVKSVLLCCFSFHCLTAHASPLPHTWELLCLRSLAILLNLFTPALCYVLVTLLSLECYVCGCAHCTITSCVLLNLLPLHYRTSSPCVTRVRGRLLRARQQLRRLTRGPKVSHNRIWGFALFRVQNGHPNGN